ncbi:MAG: M15 family metallopeptidase [Saprospiraceae bacterium]|nr:M15 family metallopeptidase [Saprospiraceae bacterium]
MLKIGQVVVLSLISSLVWAQIPDLKLPISKYGLPVVKGVRTYKAIVKSDPENQLIDLRDIIPDAKYDVRYSTTNNLLGRVLYPTADVFMRKPAAMALRQVQENLKQLGYGLVFHDGYRPYEITVVFYEEIKDTTYVADPHKGSRHNRGMAIDLSMYDLKSGEIVEMPSGYDETTVRSHHDYMDASPEALQNRQILKDAMLDVGFEIYPYEWWHYDYKGWEQCYTYDIWHKKLKKVNKKLFRKSK